MENSRLEPLIAAKMFAKENFSASGIVLLGGSVVRGEATETSDLDIVVIDCNVNNAYRESLVVYEWPIEVFVHNTETLMYYFKSDCERARPSLPRMVAEGIIIKDNGSCRDLKETARELLSAGPKEWNTSTLMQKRYFLTDLLDDFIGSTNHGESIFIAGSLAEALHEFVLRTNRRWVGSSKWIVRALKEYDREFADTFVDNFDYYYKTGDKQSVISLVDAVLQPYGGRLFHGFSIGKKHGCNE
ncbi:nucleotidyltransferase domain-containing protein [Rossellomorea oryzaecorticis]|uniref:Nucleotidyltransferase domain-containing protein n=1 Tax=Rossellomorea oryzaecorticis TaxID=1396505 RepID=A0ABU9K5Z2_9BACI